jgi:phosphoglucomutase
MAFIRKHGPIDRVIQKIYLPGEEIPEGYKWSADGLVLEKAE